MKKFFPKKSITIPASDPHPQSVEYKVSIGEEMWGKGIKHKVVKVQMLRDGKVEGRKSPSYPVGTKDFKNVSKAAQRLLSDKEKSVASNRTQKFNNGMIFEHAFDLLQWRVNQGIGMVDKGNPLDALLLIPLAVNGSFACEQYIKSLLQYEEKEHNLRTLFKLLGEEEQSKIKARAIEEIAKQPGGPSSYGEDLFEQDLLNMGDGFEDWRYFYEGNTKKTSAQFYKGFMIALRVVARERLSKKIDQ